MRTYASPLREEQTRATRERILDAVTRVLGRGVAELSVPAVAREAGVSVPTVYRHFGDKRELVEALSVHLVAQQGVEHIPSAHSPEELAALIRTLYPRVEGRDPAISAALGSEAGHELRQVSLDRRRRLIESALERLAERLPAADARRLVNTYMLLFASETLWFFRNYLDLSSEETAETAAWAVLALARGAVAQNEGRGR